MTFAEYVKAIKDYLMNGSYHYSETDADSCVKRYDRAIREDYENDVSPEDCAVDIGFSCG